VSRVLVSDNLEKKKKKRKEKTMALQGPESLALII
jgi:hypothetical protein